ncbi:unnamed protein product [Leptidea sinapis]|uniref:Uncharacterized protein n=1 Tax=Leptidea sinapis TaxID=189913 RepID=A0A5E4PZS7_9NEOP|nr:unnamed protein product [Leptidea sinapis]
MHTAQYLDIIKKNGFFKLSTILLFVFYIKLPKTLQFALQYTVSPKIVKDEEVKRTRERNTKAKEGEKARVC